jgi:serine/threonine-protein kinase
MGSGGEGDVYEAKSRDGARCALKQLNFDATDPAQKTNLERVFRLKRLIGKRSPYVCAIYDVFIHDGLAYVAMEFVEGSTLDRVLAKVTRLSLDELIQILRSVLSGLDWLHNDGIVHRDVKPANIVLVDGAVGVIAKLIDLGIALDRHRPRLTHKSGIVATVEYAAPEMLLGGEAEVDERSDIYCCGTTFFELATGRVPFDDASACLRATFIKRLCSPHRPSICDHVPDFPEAVDRCIQRMMAVKPEDRPGSAAQAWKEFYAAATASSGRGPLDPSAHMASAFTAADDVHCADSNPEFLVPSVSERHFRIESGPLAGQLICVPRSGISLGRTRLNPDDKGISRFHFRATATRNEVTLRDIGSFNGLIYRDRRVRHVRLVPGETLTVGETPLRLV